MLGKLSSLTDVVNSLRENGVRGRQYLPTKLILRLHRWKTTPSQNSYKAKHGGGQSGGPLETSDYQT